MMSYFNNRKVINIFFPIKKIRIFLFLAVLFYGSGFSFQGWALDSLRAGYFDVGSVETPVISWNEVNGQNDVVYPFCLYRVETLSDHTEQLAPFFGPPGSGFGEESQVDNPFAGYSNLANTGVLEYWGKSDPSFGCLGNQFGAGLTPTTDLAIAVPRVKYSNLVFDESVSTFATMDIHNPVDYTAVYVFAVAIGANVPDPALLQVIPPPTQGDHTIEFDLNFLYYSPYGTQYDYHIFIYGVLGPVAPINPNDLLGFPEAGSLASRVYFDDDFTIQIDQKPPPRAPINLRAFVQEDPAKVRFSWTRTDVYSRLEIFRNDETEPSVILPGLVTGYTFFDEPIGGPDQVYSIRGFRSADGKYSARVAETDVLIPQMGLPSISSLTGGRLRFDINVECPAGQYAGVNTISRTRIRMVNVNTQRETIRDVMPCPLQTAIAPVLGRSETLPQTYEVSAQIEANGILSEWTPSQLVTVEEFEAPQVTGNHLPQWEEGRTNPDLWYQAKFTLAADQHELYDFVEVREYPKKIIRRVGSGLRGDGNTGTGLIALLSPANNFEETVPVHQAGYAIYYVQGFTGNDHSNGDYPRFSVQPMAPDAWAWINGEAETNPGHVLNLRIRHNLPFNDHGHFTALAIIEDLHIVPVTPEAPSGYTLTTHEIAVFLEEEAIVAKIPYPLDHSGDGMHAYRVKMKVSSYRGKFQSYSSPNPFTVHFGVRQWDYNNDDRVDIDDINRFNDHFRNFNNPANPPPSCYESINGNGNGFVLVPDYDSTPDPNNSTANIDEAWLHCNGPHFNGTDDPGTGILPGEDQEDLYNQIDILLDAIYYDQNPARQRPLGFFGTPPPKPGEPGYDANNFCMSNYIHNRENGSFNQLGIPCVHGPAQSGYPDQIEVGGYYNQFHSH